MITRFFGRVGVRTDDGRELLSDLTAGASVLTSTLSFLRLRKPLIGTSSSLSLATGSRFTAAAVGDLVVCTDARLPFTSVLTVTVVRELEDDDDSVLTVVTAVVASALTVMSMPARASARSFESGMSSSLSELLLLLSL